MAEHGATAKGRTGEGSSGLPIASGLSGFKGGAMKTVKVYSPKHQVVEQEREGMPLSTSADCLSDPKGKTTAAFRKECWRSRARVFMPAATPKPGYPQRKISEKSFKQLSQSFRRSYRKRFQQIPRRIAQLEKLRAASTKTQCLKITQAQNGLRSIAALHDANMKLVNAEIIKRHL